MPANVGVGEGMSGEGLEGHRGLEELRSAQ